MCSFRVSGNIAIVNGEYKSSQIEYSNDNGKTWKIVPGKWNLTDKFDVLLRTKQVLLFILYVRRLKGIKISAKYKKTFFSLQLLFITLFVVNL